MQDYLDNLQLIGLSYYESKIYNSLVGNLHLTIKEISQLAEVPRTKCYDALKNLEQGGWISRLEGRPLKYSAQDPKLVFKRKREELYDSLLETESYLVGKWEKRDLYQVEPISVIHGSDYIREATQEAMRSAKKSLFMIIRFIIPGEFSRLLTLFKKAKASGISLRIMLYSEIYEQLDQQEQDMLRELDAVRLGPVPIRALVVDQERVLMSFVPIINEEIDYEYAQTIVISYENFTTMMQQSLNISWDRFEPIN